MSRSSYPLHEAGLDPATLNLVLHSDNGAAMKGSIMLATLRTLGVLPSFSRPSVSNDNPFSESLFRTLKYVPSHPRDPLARTHARASSRRGHDSQQSATETGLAA